MVPYIGPHNSGTYYAGPYTYPEVFLTMDPNSDPFTTDPWSL